MNIELRWVERRLFNDGNLVDRVQIGWQSVLQYRERGTSIPPQNGWSDWRDVPVVKEGEK